MKLLSLSQYRGLYRGLFRAIGVDFRDHSGEKIPQKSLNFARLLGFERENKFSARKSRLNACRGARSLVNETVARLTIFRFV